MATVTRGYKFRMYPNTVHKDLLARSFGHSRFLYNHLLNDAIREYEFGIEDDYGIGSRDFANRIPGLKKEYDWLNEVSSVALQQKVMDLARAFINFFRRLKEAKTSGARAKITFPKFKNKNSKQSIRLVGGAIRLNNGEFRLPKCDTPIRIRWSRELPSKPTSCTITKTLSGEYYISFICKCEPRKTSGTKETGVDLGLTDLAVFSDGTRFPNPRHFVNAHRKLIRLQRQHARKQKGSKNREKSRIKVARLHQHVANQRKDLLHKLTRTLINENQVIGIESLAVKNMMGNRRLAKHIGDAGWRMFRTFLSYKAQESGHVYIVSMHERFPSSHLCSVTGQKLDRKLSLKERKWDCPFCHQTHDRDINAARNILKRALECVADNPIGELLLIDSRKPSY